MTRFSPTVARTRRAAKRVSCVKPRAQNDSVQEKIVAACARIGLTLSAKRRFFAAKLKKRSNTNVKGTQANILQGLEQLEKAYNPMIPLVGADLPKLAGSMRRLTGLNKEVPKGHPYKGAFELELMFATIAHKAQVQETIRAYECVKLAAESVCYSREDYTLHMMLDLMTEGLNSR